jgi:hypothetical protein
MSLGSYTVAEIANWLYKLDYKVIHKDRIRTSTVECRFLKHQLEMMEAEAERVVRNQLAHTLGRFLAKSHIMHELPGETEVRYRMDLTTIGPKVSPHTEDYWHLCTQDPSRQTSG